MNQLLAQTLAVTSIMFLLSALPLFVQRIQVYSHILLLFGTGSLLGICLFDLFPDVLHLGGRTSILVMFLVWAVYLLFHIFHLHYHEQSDRRNHEGRFFIISMVIHCLASGMLLAVAQEYSPSIAKTVFLALLAHKGYEAFSVSSVLQNKVHSRKKLWAWLLLYSISLPIGVFSTVWIGLGMLHSTAVLLISISAGTLLGCMMYDFLIPSFKQIQQSKKELLWLILGMVLTLVFTSVT